MFGHKRITLLRPPTRGIQESGALKAGIILFTVEIIKRKLETVYYCYFISLSASADGQLYVSCRFPAGPKGNASHARICRRDRSEHEQSVGHKRRSIPLAETPMVGSVWAFGASTADGTGRIGPGVRASAGTGDRAAPSVATQASGHCQRQPTQRP